MPNQTIYFSTFGINAQTWPNYNFEGFDRYINIFWFKWHIANLI